MDAMAYRDQKLFKREKKRFLDLIKLIEHIDLVRGRLQIGRTNDHKNLQENYSKLIRLMLKAVRRRSALGKPYIRYIKHTIKEIEPYMQSDDHKRIAFLKFYIKTHHNGASEEFYEKNYTEEHI